ncbi:muscarinic acetylcholine receptor M1 [Sphaerodactylus townsendi]|nr:muscarinic acetylcholine receptor M1 [Sphaerodactylus townsendi]XP_048341063.1 muscarinic acetylcholine receptor M1 [Sphaerodactylus townsendi]XP_048341923.1 muscarinic acetylcholine receptor M1 [Sphaerodactylus townsendi]
MWLSFWDPFLEGSKERNRRVTMNLSDSPLGHNDSLEVQGTPSETGHSLWEMVLIIVTTGILSLVTVVGNLLVMVSFKVNRELKTVNNYYLLSLAGADLIIGTISMNLYTTYIVMGRWAMGSVACDLWLALDYVASNASVMNLLIICFDRYFSITRPLTYRAKRTPKRAAVMIGLAWAISFVLWAPAILFWQNLVGKRTVPENDCYIQFLSVPTITFGTAIAAFYLPVTIMVALYWRIYQETQKRAKELSGLQASEFKSNPRVASKTTQNGGSSSSSERSHPATSSDVAIVPMKACCFPGHKTKGFSLDRSSNGSWNTTEEEEVEEASADSLSSSEGEEQPFEVHSICSMVIRLPMISTVIQPPRETEYRDPKTAAKRDWVGEKGLVTIPKQPPDGDKRLKKAMIPLRDKSLVVTKRQIPRKQRQRNHLSKRKTLSLVKERKAARTLSAILLAFIITWTPYNIMVLVSTFCQECIPQGLWKLGYWLCYVNSTVNPMCYALCNRSFRTTFRMLLQCHWNRHNWRKMPKKGACGVSNC